MGPYTIHKNKPEEGLLISSYGLLEKITIHINKKERHRRIWFFFFFFFGTKCDVFFGIDTS